MIKKFFNILFIFLVFFSFISLASSQITAKVVDGQFNANEKHFVEKSYEYLKLKLNNMSSINLTKKFLGFQQPQEGDNIFGFKILTLGSFGRYFFIGLLAGIILWFVQLLLASFLFKFLGYVYKKGRDPLKEIKGGIWIKMISNRLYKAPLFGLIFAILMQIPILNRILQYITLDFWFIDSTGGAIVSYIIMPFILIVEVALLPHLLEKYFQIRTQTKYEKQLTNAKKIAIRNQVEEEISEEKY